MKRKVDFTVKGTKLPVIPNGTEYSTVNSTKWHKTTEFTAGLHQLKSEGIANGLGCIYASCFVIGSNHFIFPISTIERLAEEQGMLWVEEETFTPITTPSSIKQHIDKIHSLEYNIRNGFSLFAGVDEVHRLSLIKDAQKQLAEQRTSQEGSRISRQ